MEDQHPQIPTEGQQHATKTQNDADPTTRYVFFWSSRQLTANAKTIDDMIDALEGATVALHLLKDAGVVLETDSSAGHDLCLVTTDPAVAQQFKFEPDTAKHEEALGQISSGGDLEAKVTAESQEETSSM